MLIWFALSSGRLEAAILVTEFFTGRIQSFDETTKVETTFATVAGNPALSGLAYSQSANTVYASALNQGGVYRFNAHTGALLGFSLLGIGPGGLSVAANGNVYVTDFGSNAVRIYDPTLTNSLGSFTVPGTPTSGVGVLNNGDVLVATAGSGVYRYDGVNVSLFSNNPAASAQIATDSVGNTYIGHGLGFADSAFRFDLSGTALGAITITDAQLGGTGNGSSTGTSPAGVAFDASGNLFIAALGRSNPGDPGGESGGLFKYDVNGNLLDTFATGSNAYSSVIQVTVVPEPTSLALLTAAGVVSAFVARRRGIRDHNPQATDV